MVEHMQPQPTHEMSQKPSLVHDYSSSAAKEAGKETVKYVAENPDTTQVINNAEAKAEQKYDDAKAEAQGMWAKYCGCLSSMQ